MSSSDHDFRRALDEMKLRAPIEDVVLERVPELRKRGSLWEACCPFHEEKTPSFKVDPRRGTWHCFGACSTGGDQIRFLERYENIDFMEAVEILSSRTGVELPRRNARDQAQNDAARERERALYGVLDRAARFYQRELQGPDGAVARRYLEERGLDASICAEFGLGFAPAAGEALVRRAQASGVEFDVLETAGLARRSTSGRGSGRPYDFFRGRLVIPIRDDRGRTVGFGARRLSDDDSAGPKYVNTPETPLFLKGRLIYALDRAKPAVRRSHRIALVEGYTDVMAAHRAGLDWVAAVLGTSTTDEHAGLLRRTGAKRIDLVFDGDGAGRKAATRALHGLLPLPDVALHVTTLPEGQDPCDVLSESSAEPSAEGGDPAERFVALLDRAPSWFDWLVDGLATLDPSELSEGVDQLLELFGRLRKPVEREARLGELAQRLNLPLTSLREQWEALPSRRRAAREARRARQVGSQAGQSRGANAGTQNSRLAESSGSMASAPDPTSAGSFRGEASYEGSSRDSFEAESFEELPSHGALWDDAAPVGALAGERKPAPRAHPLVIRAFEDLLSAVLVDLALVPRLRLLQPKCTDPELSRILTALFEVYDTDDDIESDRLAGAVLDALGADPSRDRVVPLLARAQTADRPGALFEGGLACLNKLDRELELAKLQREVREIEARTDLSPAEAGEQIAQLALLQGRMAELFRSAAASPAAAPSDGAPSDGAPSDGALSDGATPEASVPPLTPPPSSSSPAVPPAVLPQTSSDVTSPSVPQPKLQDA